MRVVVTNPFFSKIPALEDELLALHPDARILKGRERLSEAEFIAFAEGCEAIIAGIFPALNETVLDALPDLKVIACASAGLDHIDAALMKSRGIRVGWVPGVNRESVSEITLSLIINLLRNVNRSNMSLRAGTWPARESGRLLRGRVVGIHGCGHIGRALVELLQPFGCTILANDLRDYGNFYRQWGVRSVSAEELWAESEILSLHLSRNRTTIGLYDAATLDKLRPGCILVNTARGRIVDEAALKQRLADGRIAAAAFDVFATEPLQDDDIATLPNMLATPHIAGSAIEAWLAMGRAAIKGLTDNVVPEPGVYPFD
jgi:phosphoglycerate dehydrogenase-like enzyme